MSKDTSRLHTPEALAKKAETLAARKASLPFHEGQKVRMTEELIARWMGSLTESDIRKPLEVVTIDSNCVHVRSASGKEAYLVHDSLVAIESDGAVTDESHLLRSEQKGLLKELVIPFGPGPKVTDPSPDGKPVLIKGEYDPQSQIYMDAPYSGIAKDGTVLEALDSHNVMAKQAIGTTLADVLKAPVSKGPPTPNFSVFLPREQPTKTSTVFREEFEEEDDDD